MNSIAVARYKQPIDWILDIPDDFEIFLYNKGEKITSPSLVNKAHHQRRLCRPYPSQHSLSR